VNPTYLLPFSRTRLCYHTAAGSRAAPD